jgi:hypothetical protein
VHLVAGVPCHNEEVVSRRRWPGEGLEVMVKVREDPDVGHRHQILAPLALAEPACNPGEDLKDTRPLTRCSEAFA